MHDANGTPLRKGDRVLIPGIITNLKTKENFCNVEVQTELGRRPDGQRDTLHALNTAQLIKFHNVNPDQQAIEDPCSDPLVGFSPETDQAQQVTDNVYFDPKTGMKPEDLHTHPETLATTA